MSAARGLIAAVGAGRMGRGIAHVFAFGGHPVALVDLKPRRAADFANLAPLGAMAETAGPWLRIVVALSDEGAAAPAGWAVPGVEVMQGLAHDAMRAAMAGDYAGRVAYVAGPPPMIQAVQRVLLLKGRLPAGDIRCDTFY